MALNPPAAIDRRGKTPLKSSDGKRYTEWPLGNRPESAPSAVNNLTVGNIGTNSMSLAWSLPATTTGIEVYRRDVTAAGAFVLIETLGTVTSYDAIGLTADNQYEWKVVALNEVGSSPDSNVVNSITAAAEPAPTISSVTGTVAQNEILSINGTFTANRNGQIAYHIGDSAAIGTEPSFLDTFQSTNISQNYKHSDDFSFNNKTGTSLKVIKQKGEDPPDNVVINLPQNLDEFYVSYEFRLVHDTTSGDSQIKMGRMISLNAGTDPILGPTLFFIAPDKPDAGRFRLPIANGDNKYHNGILTKAGTLLDTANPSATWTADPTAGNWYRIITYFRRKSGGGLAARLYKVIDHDANVQVYRVNANDGSTNQTADWNTGELHDQRTDIPNTWIPPRVFDFDDSYSFSKLYLPYFAFTADQASTWWVDCVHLNDSLERVEIGNGPDIYTCGKLVQQPMNSRTTSLAEIEFEQGNLLTSEDWYLFVTNRNGTPSEGYLIRSAT